MNIYYCRECGSSCDSSVDGPRCPNCDSYNVGVLGPLHLGALGLNIYVSIMRTPRESLLLIQKPSGQVWVKLDDTDLIEEVSK